MKRKWPPGRTALRMTGVLDALDESPGLTIAEMAERLEWNHETTRFYLWHAQKDGDVYKRKTARGVYGENQRYRYYLIPLMVKGVRNANGQT